jgi:hypothetical protein
LFLVLQEFASPNSIYRFIFFLLGHDEMISHPSSVRVFSVYPCFSPSFGDLGRSHVRSFILLRTASASSTNWPCSYFFRVLCSRVRRVHPCRCFPFMPMSCVQTIPLSRNYIVSGQIGWSQGAGKRPPHGKWWCAAMSGAGLFHGFVDPTADISIKTPASRINVATARGAGVRSEQAAMQNEIQ